MSNRRSAIAAAAVMGAGLAGWWWLGERGPATPRTTILISVDTLRPDHLGCYGYRRPTSPVFDALAEGGVVFEDVSTPAPWTLPAHASLLTGLYPSRHGLKSHERYLPAPIVTLAQVLARKGYRTAAVVNSHNLSSRFGLDRGFQDFRYVEESVAQVAPTSEIIDQAITWLEKRGDHPLFLFVHTYDVHSDYRSLAEYEAAFVEPYDGPADGTTAQLIAVREGKLSLGEADARHLVDLYDAGIRQWDGELGRLLRFLKDNRMLEETLLIITSDHGEEFFEHGGFLHGRTQYQEVMAVPLVLRGPGLPSGERVAQPASLVDLMPTVLALLRIPAPEALDGRDLRPFWQEEERREAGPRLIFGEADHNNQEPDITRAARRGRYKLHYNRLSAASALFNLSEDPRELLDVASRHPGIADQLRGEILRFMERGPAGEAPALQLTPEEIEKLRSLGYVN
jgi:arylsulfatase A-like enzyme